MSYRMKLFRVASTDFRPQDFDKSFNKIMDNTRFLQFVITLAIAKSVALQLVDAYDRLEELRKLSNHPTKESCIDNYSPCTCIIDGIYGISVTCSDLFDPFIVQDVFNRTTTQDIGSLTIANFIFPSIPSNILSGKRARRIVLRSGVNRLVVDPNAFRSTADYTQTFDIVYMSDMSTLKFNFLDGFYELQSLGLFGNSYGVAASIPTLPPLPYLKELIIVQSDLYRIGSEFPDLSPATLERLWLSGNRLDDSTSDAILNKVITSTSGASMVHLELYDNALTRVPQVTRFFLHLSYLDIQQNNITGVYLGDFTFQSPVFQLDISRNPIENNFQSDCFEGDFSDARIFGESLGMTTLPSGSFQEVLEQMVQSNKNGSVVLTSNFFECDCNLAWLLRDRRYLLDAVENAICNDGLLFQNTNGDQFQNCP